MAFLCDTNFQTSNKTIMLIFSVVTAILAGCTLISLWQGKGYYRRG